MLLTYIGAGGLAALWLRALGLGRGAALAGGLAFALAPYRVAQSTGHLLGPVSMLLPLSLWAVETRRNWVAAAAVASIPLSGQVHLALGAIPFFAAYAAARRGPRAAVPGVVASLAAGVLVWATSIRGSTGASGRTFAEVERYSAGLADFVSRDVREFEAFVLLGWLVPLAALAGLLLQGRQQPRLAAVLGVGALLPLLLALGANLPGYRTLWEHTPLRDTRVPARLMPIACLALAGLLALAVDRVRWRFAALAAVALVAVDLRAGITLYRPLTASADDPAYRLLRTLPGRFVEVPLYAPDAYAGSIYTYYAMQARRERPTGYATAAPRRSDLVAQRLIDLQCGGTPAAYEHELRRLGVRYVVVHWALLRRPDAYPACADRTLRHLRKIGYRVLAGGKGVQLRELRRR